MIFVLAAVLASGVVALVWRGAPGGMRGPRARFTPHEPRRPTLCPEGAVAFQADPNFRGHARDNDRTDGIQAFCLDAREVSVAQFRAYWRAQADESRHETEPQRRSERDPWCTWSESPEAHETHPINCVSGYTLAAYCAWRGGRLPSDLEWEYAAHETPAPRFPWGNESPTASRDNLCGLECAAHGWGAMRGYGDDRFPETAPVGSFAPVHPEEAMGDSESERVVFDLGGNVKEWVTSARGCWVTPTFDQRDDDGAAMAVRGAAWSDDREEYAETQSETCMFKRRWSSAVGGRCAYAMGAR